MKCEFCGGDLSLEAEVCPHCGQLNKHAQQHIRDMKRYHGEFQDTKKGVYSVTERYTAVTVRVIIIAVLAMVIALSVFVYSKAFSIHHTIKRGIAIRNAKEYMQIMDEYLAKEDFRAFSIFCEDNEISYGWEEKYEKYAPVVCSVNNYIWICDGLMGLIDDDMDPQSYQVQNVSSNLEYFYEHSDFSRYEYYTDADREENVKAVEAMEREIELMLQTYLGFTEEEVAGLRDMSEARRTVLIEEKLANGKEQ